MLVFGFDLYVCLCRLEKSKLSFYIQWLQAAGDWGVTCNSIFFYETCCNLCRIGRGIWRRGAETPVAVKWEDRSIEIREGSWSYVASTSSVGYAPGNFSMHNNLFPWRSQLLQ